ncbi:LuxR C-terminal-related transcriptional regulator [Erwiniaceae bacterium BAC15a-03b]|uniref:LuxR C-terminal-related transcriptional regulator n=1 Tax=Winslowiella arboricola TaxID=2978220 RepID=A0A9J6PJD4_9GAMM|nr:LuxR C-terminal-related transcriptional regulator [Winslowiella arboricola]MCU5773493.1 LuxR C-terminal-related transcriptional regulator [Winslowiella arboricola]MCU5776595.1 LuxR C-terminal-related transcriptional regulator [Winslowiella arboricola]
MQNQKYDIIFFSSDVLAATGLCQLLQQLPISLKVLEVNAMHDIAFHCKKHRPKLVVCIFHENMALTGTLHSIYTHQQHYPDIRQLVITSKLNSVMSALKEYLPGTNVTSLKTPLAELSWIITAELMGVRSQLPKDSGADVMLPERQLKVLLMLSWSYSAEQVAHRLGITAKTVYAHKLNALARLQIHTRQDIVDLYTVIDELRMIVTMLRLRRKDKDASEKPGKQGIPALIWKK